MVMRRKKIKLRYKKERTIFSDVLPYELPLIFSNRYFYKLLVRNEVRIKFEADGKNILTQNELVFTQLFCIRTLVTNKLEAKVNWGHTFIAGGLF